MAFSFNNQGQEAGTPQSQAAPVSGQQPAQQASKGATPSVPDSPFLFIQYRGQEMPVNAYLQMVLLLLAALSVLASIVLFAYSSYLTSSIESKKQELAASDTTFSEYPIEEMKRFSLRKNNLQKILTDYVSVASPLKFLEAVVEKQVVFNDFTLAKKDSGYVAEFTAVTSNYRFLIQQLEALNLSEYKRIAPTPKPGKPLDSAALVKVRVTTPVFAQGVLSESIIFDSATNASTSQTQKNVSLGTSTPQ